MSEVSAILGAGGVEIPVVSQDAHSQLSQEEFLKVMIAQLTNQTPDNSVDVNEYVDSFMGLGNYQATQDMSDNVNKTYAAQQYVLAQSLVGANVEVTWANVGGSHIGVVESARVQDGEVIIVVDGIEHTSSEILQILQPEQQQ